MTDTCRLDRSSPFWAAFFWLVVAGLVTAGIVLKESHFFVAAILPAALGLWIFITSPRAENVTFGPEALLDECQENPIRYDEIMAISISGKTPEADAHVIPGGNLVVIDHNRCHYFSGLKQAAAKQMYQSLIDRIPESGSREVAPALQQRLQNDLNLFDDDLIFSFRARPKRLSPRKRFHFLFFILVIVGIVWAGIGGLQVKFDAWTFVGGFLTGFTVIGWLLYAAATVNHATKIPDYALASLIVSPRGIALHQGRVVGEMKWEEMKVILCGKGQPGSLVTAATPRSICIRVDGAQVQIFDIYDRPLATIFRCMKRYWESR